MNLYLLESGGLGGYDTYDSAVVAAPDEQTARHIHPGMSLREGEWDEWVWCRPEQVKVTLIGLSAKDEQGVILASFNAG